MADIFISYARQDREKVEQLSRALESQGYTVWWDRHIAGGADFSAVIERELEAAGAVIVGWSDAGSKSKWVKDEASIAADAGKLIAISLDGAAAPIGYRQYHCIDLKAWQGRTWDEAITEISRAVEGCLGGDAPGDRKVLSTPIGKTSRRSLGDFKTLAGTLAAIVAVVALAFGWWPRSDEMPMRATSFATGVSERSVAVLPFESMSAADEDRHFADGLSEELLNTLAGIDDLKVPGRTATFAFKGETANLSEIGRSLGVAHVLEGSIRRSGDRLRITAKLSAVDDGYQIWSETYDRGLDDLFAIQDDIAKRVANALNSRLVDGDALLFDAGTQSAAAFQHYLAGRQYLSQRGQWLSRAIVSFESAIDTDPGYARAYAGLATAHVVSHIYLSVPKEIARKRAHTFATKAAELDPTLSEPLAVLGAIESDQTHWEEAAGYYREGEQRNPDDVVVLQWHAELLANLGYLKQARLKIDRALTLDPGSAIIHLVAGNIALCQNDFDAAEALYLRAKDLGISAGINGVSLVAFERGEIDRAARLRAETTLHAQLIAEDDIDSLTAFYSQIMRREVSVDSGIAAFPTLATDDDFLMPAYLFAGERENALGMLETDPDGDLDSFFMLWSDLDPELRGHPRFEVLARNTGLLDYWRRHGWPDKCRPGAEGATDALACD